MSKLVRGAGNVLSKRASAVGDRCACNKSIYSALAQKFECLPSKWTTAGAEFKEGLKRYRACDVTLGEVGQHAVYVGVGCVLFFTGEFIGRGSIIGYKV